MEEDFGSSKIGRIRKYLWDLTEYPETSKAAQVKFFIAGLFVRYLTTRRVDLGLYETCNLLL